MLTMYKLLNSKDKIMYLFFTDNKSENLVQSNQVK